MSSLVIAGDTSGTITLQAPAVSGSNVLTLPLATATVGLAPLVTTFTSSGTWTPRATSVMVSHCEDANFNDNLRKLGINETVISTKVQV